MLGPAVRKQASTEKRAVTWEFGGWTLSFARTRWRPERREASSQVALPGSTAWSRGAGAQADAARARAEGVTCRRTRPSGASRRWPCARCRRGERGSLTDDRKLRV